MKKDEDFLMLIILKDIKIKEIKFKILNNSVCKLIWIIYIDIKINKERKYQIIVFVNNY